MFFVHFLFFVFFAKTLEIIFCCLRLFCFYLLHGFTITKPYVIDGAAQVIVVGSSRNSGW